MASIGYPADLLFYLAAFVLGCMLVWPFVAGRWKARLTRETRTLRGQLGAAEQGARDARGVAERTESRLTSLRSRLDDHGPSLAAARDAASRATAERDSLTGELAQRDAEIGSLRGRLSEIGDALQQVEVRDARIVELENALAASTSTQTSARGELSGVRAELATLRPRAARVEELETELASSREAGTRAIETLQSELHSADRSSADLADVNAHLADQSAHVLHLQAEVERQRSRIGRLEGLEVKVTERDARIRDIQGERDRSVAARDRTLEDLRARIAHRDEQVDTLRMQIAEHRCAPVAVAAAAPASGVRRPQNERRDDLQRIKGIGPKLERMLNEIGIVRFGQISRWLPADIARITEQLDAFPDRIRRDDWITQAQHFSREPAQV